MKKHLVKIVSEFKLSDEELEDYVYEQKFRWVRDNPNEVKSLESEGRARFVDDDGVTNVLIIKNFPGLIE